MRFAAAGIVFLLFAACSTAPQTAEQALVRDDGWRNQQAVLDAEAIMQGMAQARHRAEQTRMAR